MQMKSLTYPTKQSNLLINVGCQTVEHKIQKILIYMMNTTKTLILKHKTSAPKVEDYDYNHQQNKYRL